MSDTYSIDKVLEAIAAGASAISSRKEEINRLNVFPVPDGDTGTNMSLTIDACVKNIQSLQRDAADLEKKRAIVTGTLMGARGNSGVILSQIFRGLADGWEDGAPLSPPVLASALSRARTVAFQAVRKPVEGTILTVLDDCATKAQELSMENISTDEVLDAIIEEARASVERTPSLLPVLRENNVVDAGGFGLMIFFEGFAAYLLGKDIEGVDLVPQTGAPKVEIEGIDDWEGANYRYCNEFLVDSDQLVIDDALEFLSTMGDCELCVGAAPRFKVHVHSNSPDKVLRYFLDRGQISDVHIHNMDMQAEERRNKLRESDHVPDAHAGTDVSFTQPDREDPAQAKRVGFVAVATGAGNKRILESLGIDRVVDGGQTMNPSTKDLLDAVESIKAASVIILPNNKNIVMAARAAAENAHKPTYVVPSTSILQCFSAMLVLGPEMEAEEASAAMEEACTAVKTGEITYAVREAYDSHVGKICEGDVIGIADGEIKVVGSQVEDVTMQLLDMMSAQEADNLTLLAGEGYSDDELGALAEIVSLTFKDLEIDPQRGDQPLYPIIFSLE